MPFFCGQTKRNCCLSKQDFKISEVISSSRFLQLVGPYAKLISCFLVYPWVLSIILSVEDEFIKQRRDEHRTVAMAREYPDPRSSCQRQRSSRGRSSSLAADWF